MTYGGWRVGDIPKVVKKGWGEELVIHNGDGYCVKILNFNEGSIGSFHFHEKKTESWYVQQGKISVKLKNCWTGKDETFEVKTGEMVHLPAGVAHQVTAIEFTSIIEGSTPHSDDDVYRIAPGDSQK